MASGIPLFRCPYRRIADLFKQSQKDYDQTLIPGFEVRMDVRKIASDFNGHRGRFPECQDLGWKHTSVARHEKADNAGNAGIGGDGAPKKLNGQDACRNGGIRRPRQEADESNGSECRPVKPQKIPQENFPPSPL